VIATASNTVTAAIPVAGSPWGMAVSPDGSKVYVANIVSNNVSVIATSSNAVTATIPVDSSPYSVAVTPDGSKVYVANQGTDNVSVIATTSNTVTSTIPVGSTPPWRGGDPGRQQSLRREPGHGQRLGDRDGEQHGYSHHPRWR